MGLRKFIHEARKHFPLPTLQKVFFGFLILIGFLTGIFIAQIMIAFSDLKDIKALENYSSYSVPTKVYDIKERLITEFYLEKRDIVTYKDLPPALIQAIISIEDNEFYQHHGFNITAFIRGVFIDPILGKRARGASTLTQQLAKNLFTTGERSIFRKLVELWYAFQIEKKYSKEEILELYFNQVYFGHGCYGAQAAAQYFFDKDVKDLSVGEASLLAGLVQLPSAYSPIFSPYRAQKRHMTVLQSMAKLGYLTKEKAEEVYEDFWENYATAIKAKGISIQRNERNYAPFFTEYVRSTLMEKYGEDRIYSGGLQIYTSLDLDKQKLAGEEIVKRTSNEQVNYNAETRVYSSQLKESYQDIIDLLSLTFGIDSIRVGSERVKNHLENLVKNYNDILYLTSFIYGLDDINRKMKSHYLLAKLVQEKQDRVEGALISINPKSGYIEAMVGGSEFSYANQFNRTILARRQMGSLFKPVYYSLAIDKKLITPASVYDDRPMVYQDGAGNLWQPRNYEGTFRGRLRVRQALQYSVNVVSIQIWDLLLKTLGYNTVANSMADYFGMNQEEAKKRIEPQLSFALGVGTFSPYEVARAFATIANDGVAVRPIAILRVKDRFGRVVDDFETARDIDKTSRQQVMSPSSAFLMQSLLNTVLYYGTGAEAAKSEGFTLSAGGKTGTTPNWKDAWFAGFTKNLTTVVWFGFDDARKSLGRHRSAAVVAAPAWMGYMKSALKDTPDVPFSMPGDVVEMPVCATTGLLPTEFCPHVINEYFLRNTAPVKKCDVHISRASANEDNEIQIITNEINLENMEINIESETDNKKEIKPEDQNLNENFNIKSGIE
jgi:penicillin-binding protein 1A